MGKRKEDCCGWTYYKVGIVFVNDYKCFTELQGLEEVFIQSCFLNACGVIWTTSNWAIDIWSLLRDYSSNVEVDDVKFKLEPPGSKIVGHDEHMMPVFSPKALKDLGGEVNGKLYGQVQPPVFEYSKLRYDQANATIKETNLPNVTYNDDCTDTIPHENQCSSDQVLEIYTSDSNNLTSSFSKNSTNKRKR
ncbi:hypothetical protein PPL_05836 [Heterostelium album PN500]|uniref:Uncharacterized protein n=1 Tax=Heterostelium pallidum (strain ATCC 26659 / Pp 5 / PN500) TaxID=670386 RepID=D3BBG8_HETP5|nr:hypothetical protein PPL_05836 [Heterostelium album PN500]EFA81001.1 hypothetical protein PPL_05836 [Heterostelium album PN500]|eukprot:XP_020433119.1 hypothetical protein PPL_05836 [Heterostelium album PN500]